MADYSGGEGVEGLLIRFVEALRDSTEREEILDLLSYTTFGPIVKYFRRELEPHEIDIFEESLKKYVFPYRLRIAYADNTYCRNCRRMSHVSDCISKVLYKSVLPLPYYHFEHLAEFSKNNSTFVTNFGYYGVSRHGQIFDQHQLYAKSTVRWYSPRAEIDDSYEGMNLSSYCFPLINDLAMKDSVTKDYYFPYDERLWSEPEGER